MGKPIINSFEKGLYRDAHPKDQPQGTYPYALNLVAADLEQSTQVSNEHSNVFAQSFTDIVGTGHIDERDQTLILQKNGEVWLFDHNTHEKIFVASDTEFGCDWGFRDCEWSGVRFKVLQPCNELQAYWSSDCEYYVINIDELLDQDRKEALKKAINTPCAEGQCFSKSCRYFHVFNPACQPTIIPTSFDVGGNLPAGAYQFAVRLIDSEGGYSNWFLPSNPVYVGSQHNEAGEIGSGYVNLDISCLDCDFSKIEIAVISTIGGITTAKSLVTTTYNTPGVTYTYDGQNGTDISLEEILVKYNTYPQGKGLFPFQGRMLYHNIRQRKNLDYQRTANDIEVSWVRYKIPYSVVKKYDLKSFMRGETYAFGIIWNYIDGTHSKVFHIPCRISTTGDRRGSYTDNPLEDVILTTTSTGPDESHRRVHTSQDETVNNPHSDDFEPLLTNLINSYDSEVSDIIEEMELCQNAQRAQGCNCCDCTVADDPVTPEDESVVFSGPLPPGSDAYKTDTARIEDIFSHWGSLLASYGIHNPTDLDKDYTPSTIKETAQMMIEAVRDRERIVRQKREIDIGKQRDDYSSSRRTTSTDEGSPNIVDCEGNILTEVEYLDRDEGSMECYQSELLYPDTRNCDGDYIYGDLACTPITHHTFPDNLRLYDNYSKVPNFYSPGADKYDDTNIYLLGVKFDNIETPEDTSIPLCEANPYTIVYVKRDTTNKSIIMKGMTTGTFVSRHRDKTFLYPRHAVNSFESVSRYIDIDDSRWEQNPRNYNSFNLWSLDALVKEPALNVNQFYVEGELQGEGFRHGLYAEGRSPTDSFNGSRIDQRGARQEILLNGYNVVDSSGTDIDFKIYAPAHSVVSPPVGASIPLMNKHQQQSVWVGGQLPNFGNGRNVDRSFLGDVLIHKSKIESARSHYVSLRKTLTSQYGDLVSMAYIPLMQSGKQSSSSIEGLVGDIYIGHHTFVKTSYVSDKVGNKFPISNLTWDNKADRCICDSPEDAIHTAAGDWVWTSLPEEGDYADAKNWAGLHTPEGSTSDLYTKSPTEVLNVWASESEYYYPKTLTSSITYFGEFETCPWRRQKGDPLEDQVIDEWTNSEYTIDSWTGNSWEDSYLNQFYQKNEQPSLKQRIQKILFRSILQFVSPAIGAAYALTGDTALDLVTGMVAAPLLVGLWYILNQVVFTNDYIDKLLGIPLCKTDEQGGEDDENIRKFFRNYNRYNSDYSKVNDIYSYYGLPDPYNTCDCDDCDTYTNNTVYISDKQVEGSELDSYRIVRPNNILSVPADSGRITNMFGLGGNLYVHTTDAIWQVQYGRPSIPSSIGEVLMGTGGILEQPIEILNVPEGFAGLKNKTNSILTQYGYFFIDEDAKKVYRFSSQKGLNDISKQGMNNFFKEHIEYCNKTECSDKNLPGSNFALGVDPRLDRFLLTKTDDDGSWTLSYDLNYDVWRSFHSYNPNFYIWDRDHMYSSKGGEIWKHDSQSSFQTFYGTFSPFVVSSIGSNQDLFSEELYHIQIETEMRSQENGKLLKHHPYTFNRAYIYNPYQTTGELLLVPVECEDDAIKKITDKYHTIDLYNKDGTWRFNNIQNTLTCDDNTTRVMSDCLLIEEPIDYNCKDKDCKQVFNGRIHFNNYLYTRFIFDNFADKKLYLRAILLNPRQMIN